MLFDGKTSVIQSIIDITNNRQLTKPNEYCRYVAVRYEKKLGWMPGSKVDQSVNDVSTEFYKKEKHCELIITFKDDILNEIKEDDFNMLI